MSAEGIANTTQQDERAGLTTAQAEALYATVSIY